MFVTAIAIVSLGTPAAASPGAQSSLASVTAYTYDVKVHLAAGYDAREALRAPPLGAAAEAPIAPVSRSPTAVAAETANEGIYVVRSEAGNYVGQSGNITQRLAQHVSTGKFTQTEVNAAERFGVSGGRTAREIAEQLKIDSPEFGGIDNLLNKVNPIGVRRLDLMPDGYTR